jgi:hypothetical protein
MTVYRGITKKMVMKAGTRSPLHALARAVDTIAVDALAGRPAPSLDEIHRLIDAEASLLTEDNR